MPAKKKPGPIDVITYGSSSIRLYSRSGNQVSIAWREHGKSKSTTRGDLATAKKWAQQKVRSLDSAAGKQWLTPAAADRAASFERLAGDPESASDLLTDLRAALQLLPPGSTLTDAVSYFIKHGPGAVQALHTITSAKDAFLREYEAHHPTVTVKPFRSELGLFAEKHPNLPLLEITHEILDSHIRRGKPSHRTIRNRTSNWITFFNRAIALGWWPDGKKTPAHTIKRPRLPDTAPPIFTPAQASAIIALIQKEQPQHLSFFIIAGFLGCRPSECQRLTWDLFDWENELLHLPHHVVGKTARERWIPLRPSITRILKPLSTSGEKRACRYNARPHISKLARDKEAIETWPVDVLRHSRITYRLQECGSIDTVAEESGNSPAEIRASYRRPIPPGMHEKWFGVLDQVKPT